MSLFNTTYDGFVYRINQGANPISNPISQIALVRRRGPYAARLYFEFVISDVQTPVLDSNLELETPCPIVNQPCACEIKSLNIQPSQSSAKNIWDSFDGTGAVLLTNNTFTQCGGSIVLDLGANADSDITNKRNAGQTWYTIGIRFPNDLDTGNDRLVRVSTMNKLSPPANPVPRLSLIY